MTGSCWTTPTMPPLRDRRIDHLGEHDLARPLRVGLGIGRVERGLQLHELDLDRGDDDLVLGLELVVDRRLRHAEGVGDHLERRAVHTVVGEQPERGRDRPGSAPSLRRTSANRCVDPARAFIRRR